METAKLVGQGGEIILVVPAEVSRHVKSGENTFVKTAVKSGLRVREILRAPEGAWHIENGMSATYYDQVMRQAADAAAVVSYVGIPSRAVLTAGGGGAKRPMFVAVLPNEYYLPESMNVGRVQLALVPTRAPENFRAVFPDRNVQAAEFPEVLLPDEPEFIDDRLTPR